MTITRNIEIPDAPRDAATLNKLMFVKLMPLLIAAYVLSFLDRTNIALAKHQLDIDLGISAAAYGLGAGLFFLTYALSEVPSNLIMHKVGARFWIARIMVTWGLISRRWRLSRAKRRSTCCACCWALPKRVCSLASCCT